MTKKDYELIAKRIKQQFKLRCFNPFNDELITIGTSEAAAKALHATVEFLSNDFEKENPRFDRWKFYEACGFTRDIIDALYN